MSYIAASNGCYGFKSNFMLVREYELMLDIGHFVLPIENLNCLNNQERKEGQDAGLQRVYLQKETEFAEESYFQCSLVERQK